MSEVATVVNFRVLHGIDADNHGHGHVWPRRDGSKVRCLQNICKQCVYDRERKNAMIDEAVQKFFDEKCVGPETDYGFEKKYVDKERRSDTEVSLEIAIRLLTKSYLQFKYYEKNHRDKMTDPSITKEKLLETFDKARANAALAKEIKDQLDEFRKRET